MRNSIIKLKASIADSCRRFNWCHYNWQALPGTVNNKSSKTGKNSWVSLFDGKSLGGWHGFNKAEGKNLTINQEHNLW